MAITLKNELLKKLLDSWKQSRRGGIVPFRSSIDVFQNPVFFSNLMIIEHVSGQESYVCRMAGEGVNSTFKTSPTGKSIEVLFETEVAAVFQSFLDSAVGMPGIVLIHGERLSETGIKKKVEAILLPLVNAENEVVQFLYAQALSYDPEQEAFDFDMGDITFDVISCRDID